jgi:uncharacterized protein YjbI with pentapeptide repeats
LGINFTGCKDFLFSFSFENCILDYSVFQKRKIHKTIFKDCSIKEADFSEADLAGSEFRNCDLMRTVFHQSIIEKVDFLNAFNYSIDPERNRIANAKFSLSGVTGLLDKYKIIIEV